tara:strand:+ start:50 stop:553 length:504 start_codon:yes stop_codon:yes gene_type:complete
MSDSSLSKIRDDNLKELNTSYQEELTNYTNMYQEYLEKMSGNEDDIENAEKDLKPKIIEKNNLLIQLAELFLKNNKESAALIEEDYKMIAEKSKQLDNLNERLNNMDSETLEGDKSEEVKAQKKIENITLFSDKNKMILTTLTIINILFLTFLVLGIVRVTILQKNL